MLITQKHNKVENFECIKQVNMQLKRVKKHRKMLNRHSKVYVFVLNKTNIIKLRCETRRRDMFKMYLQFSEEVSLLSAHNLHSGY